MAEEHICISIYTTPGQAAEALALLLSAGFEGSALSLLGRDRWAESQSVGTCRMGNALVYRGTQGDTWEKICSGIPGRGGIWFFEDGPLLVAGRVADSLTTAPGEPMAPGAKGLETALTRFGVPEASAGSYASELSNHRLLLFVHGSLEATDHAQHLLSVTPATNHTLHHGASG
ncbi:hypothetical protein JXA47_04340 [Candidatus Sumerlaeota bacterium]|nr:hypothetical protein [Candidatus Sumerlaeota bacterium]